MDTSENEKSAAVALHQKRLEEIWAHLESLGITEQDVLDAVEWARHANHSTIIKINGGPGETSVFELPEEWFEYSLTDGVDERQPGIYQWTIEEAGSYIGKYSHIDRPKKQYGRNVKRKLNGKPYRKSKEQGFRRIHEALAEAVKCKRKIQLCILENVEPARLQERETELIRQMRPKLNGSAAGNSD